MTTTELNQIAEQGKSKILIPSRLAIVAPEDLSFGLSRVFNVHREDQFINQQVFRTEQEALVWFKKG